jgi:hypothetical protein
MNINSATEIIELNNAASASPELTYDPVWISTDRRQVDPTKTTMKFAQLGGPTAADKIGNTYGPIFRMEFVDLSTTATHVQIWALDNDDVNSVGAIYPKAYLLANPRMDVWLKKFEFTDANGTPVTGGTYTIYGHRKRQYPIQF